MLTRNAMVCLAMAACALGARAETITLTGSPCDANRNCYPQVANDENVPMTLYANPASTSFYLYVDGTMFVGQGSGYGDINQVAYDTNGSVVHVAVRFYRYTTRVTSGRDAGRTVNHWSIVGGTVVR